MKKSEIVIIAALARTNRVIGQAGKMPWRIPEDSARFKALTLGHSVIMGRKTWEFDLEGCPLPDRRNWVITHDPDRFNQDRRVAELDGGEFVPSLKVALAKTRKDPRVFIAGGATIYAQALPLADTLELTLVEGLFEGDTFFPAYQHLIGSQFGQVVREEHPGYCFETYRRLAVPLPVAKSQSLMPVLPNYQALMIVPPKVQYWVL